MKKLLRLAGFSMHTNGVPHRRENRPGKGPLKAGRRAALLVSWMLLLALSACSGDFLSSLLSPTASPATLAVDETETAAPVLPTPTQTTAAAEEVQTLTLWLPPQFDPNSGSDAGNLLKTRLEEFSQQNPDVILQVRIKALSGAGADRIADGGHAGPRVRARWCCCRAPIWKRRPSRGWSFHWMG